METSMSSCLPSGEDLPQRKNGDIGKDRIAARVATATMGKRSCEKDDSTWMSMQETIAWYAQALRMSDRK